MESFVFEYEKKIKPVIHRFIYFFDRIEEKNIHIDYYVGTSKNAEDNYYFYIIYFVKEQAHIYFSNYRATWIGDTKRYEKKKQEFLRWFRTKKMKGMFKLADTN